MAFSMEHIQLVGSRHIPVVLGAVSGLLLLRIVWTLVYRIYFHPLSKHPGPKITAATGLYYMYKYVTGEEVAFVTELHKKYGDVVRIGPDRMSYICPDAWKDIYGHRIGGRQENGKDYIFYARELNGAYTVLSTPDPDEHGQRRKIFTHAFSDKALRSQEAIIRQYVQQLIGNIQRDVAANPNAHMDAVKLYNCATFDIMADLTFGEPLGLLERSEYTPWVDAIFKGIKARTLGRLIGEYPAFASIIAAVLPKDLEAKRREHFNHSVTRVDKRLAKGTDVEKADFWKLVLERGKEQLTLDQMYADSSLFMIAGTETTATLLSGLTYLLLTTPEKLQKVAAEVRALDQKDLSLEKLPKLPYMNACIEEALRMYPPVPTGLPRRVAPGGAKIAGDWIPENTRVTVSHFAAYHSERNFVRPDSFEPERWLPESGYDSDRKSVLQPFSTGPRNCIGKNLAYHEIRIILASVIWHFDMELCPESEGWSKQKVFSLWEKHPLYVKFRSIRTK